MQIHIHIHIYIYTHTSRSLHLLLPATPATPAATACSGRCSKATACRHRVSTVCLCLLHNSCRLLGAALITHSLGCLLCSTLQLCGLLTACGCTLLLLHKSKSTHTSHQFRRGWAGEDMAPHRSKRCGSDAIHRRSTGYTFFYTPCGRQNVPCMALSHRCNTLAFNSSRFHIQVALHHRIQIQTQPKLPPGRQKQPPRQWCAHSGRACTQPRIATTLPQAWHRTFLAARSCFAACWALATLGSLETLAVFFPFLAPTLTPALVPAVASGLAPGLGPFLSALTTSAADPRVPQ